MKAKYPGDQGKVHTLVFDFKIPFFILLLNSLNVFLITGFQLKRERKKDNIKKTILK
jgi:hypothetical protein